jgi:hypothetical protein
VDNVVAQAPEQTNHATLLLEYKTGRTINQPLLCLINYLIFLSYELFKKLGGKSYYMQNK